MPDLRSALEEAFNKTEPTEVPNIDDQLPEKAEPIDKPRDEQGKFAKAEKPVEKTETSVEKPIEKAVDKPVEPPKEEAKPSRRAPGAWKPDAQAAWIKADKGEPLTPDEIRVMIGETERREADFHKGVQEFKTHADRARLYDQAIAPYADHIKQLGVDAPTAITALLKADHTLRTSDPYTKRQYLDILAREYGIDLNQEYQQPSPEVAKLQQELNNLRQQQQTWQNNASQQQTAQAQYELSQSGVTKEPHFEAVREDMAILLQSGRAENLKQAYEMAVWMRPDIRTTLIDQQRADDQKRLDAEKQAMRAKAAAVSVKSSSPNSGSQSKGLSLRETIAAQFAD